MCRSLFAEHSSGFEDAGSKGSIGRVRSLSGGGLQSPVRAFATQSLRGATASVPAGGGEWHGAGHRRVRSTGTPRAGAGGASAGERGWTFVRRRVKERFVHSRVGHRMHDKARIKKLLYASICRVPSTETQVSGVSFADDRRNACFDPCRPPT